MSVQWEGTYSTTVEAENKRLGQQKIHRGDMKITQRRPVQGQIIEQKLMVSRLGYKTLRIRVHLDGRDSKITRGVEDRWYGLGYPVDFIVHVFGNNLIGRRCELRYKTIDPNSGIAYIIHDDGFRSDLDAAETLPALATILGPPGSGI